MLFQAGWKVFSVSIPSLNNIPEFTACQEKRTHLERSEQCAVGVLCQPSQAESCGVSSVQDKPPCALYIKSDLSNNKSADAELASRNQMAALSLPGGAVFFLLLFLRFDRGPTHISAGLASVLCEAVERGHFVLGNGFHLITQQALLTLWCLSLCQSHHLHQCKKNRLSVMVTSDGHTYCICLPSGHVLTLTCHAVKGGNITFHWPVGCRWM